MGKRCFIYRSRAYPIKESDEALVEKLGPGHNVWKNAKGASIIIMADGCPKHFPRKRVIYRRDLNKQRKYSHAYDIRDEKGNVTGVLKVPFQMRLSEGESPEVFGRMNISEYHLVDENSLKTVPSAERPKGGVVTGLHHSIMGHLERLRGPAPTKPATPPSEPKPESVPPPNSEANPPPESKPAPVSASNPKVIVPPIVSPPVFDSEADELTETLVEQDTRTTRVQSDYWDPISRDEVLNLKGAKPDKERPLKVEKVVLDEFKDAVSKFFLEYNVRAKGEDEERLIGDDLHLLITGAPEEDISLYRAFRPLHDIYIACMVMKSHTRMSPGRVEWDVLREMYENSRDAFFKFEAYIVGFIKWISRGVMVFEETVKIFRDLARPVLYQELLESGDPAIALIACVDRVMKYNFKAGEVQFGCQMASVTRDIMQEFISAAIQSKMPLDMPDVSKLRFKESPSQLIKYIFDFTRLMLAKYNVDGFHDREDRKRLPTIVNTPNLTSFPKLVDPGMWTADNVMKSREELSKIFNVRDNDTKVSALCLGLVYVLIKQCDIIDETYMWIVDRIFTPQGLFGGIGNRIKDALDITGKVPKTLDMRTNEYEEAIEERTPDSLKD